MHIDEVHFNHTPDSATGGAIDVRRNADGDVIHPPEWKANAKSEPAAYAAASVGSTVTIRVSLRGGPPGRIVAIRAQDDWPLRRKGLMGLILRLLRHPLRYLLGGGVLGDVAARNVTFDDLGNSALEEFVLSKHSLPTAAVNMTMVRWRWEQKGSSGWVDFDTTTHQIFVLAALPSEPWQQSGGVDVVQIPWTEALEKACVWAAGLKGEDEIAEAIAKGIHDLPSVGYQTASVFWSNRIRRFELMDFLAELNGGGAFNMNCRDCANAVVTFGNLLGCHLDIALLGDLDNRQFSHTTRPLLARGTDGSVSNNWKSMNWSWHEAARNQLGGVYDAAARVDLDRDDTDDVHTACQPVGMPLRPRANPRSYLSLLLLPSTSVQVKDEPRRPVG